MSGWEREIGGQGNRTPCLFSASSVEQQLGESPYDGAQKGKAKVKAGKGRQDWIGCDWAGLGCEPDETREESGRKVGWEDRRQQQARRARERKRERELKRGGGGGGGKKEEEEKSR
ncbi:hypothetical protein LY76DRAFT_192159 [Colletotrichum caudatum]|nr:hypothetical protein LY76DRAFT_192159 [Colletotrichum caudatum]